jgi:hypothetical protein
VAGAAAANLPRLLLTRRTLGLFLSATASLIREMPDLPEAMLEET